MVLVKFQNVPYNIYSISTKKVSTSVQIYNTFESLCIGRRRDTEKKEEKEKRKGKETD